MRGTRAFALIVLPAILGLGAAAADHAGPKGFGTPNSFKLEATLSTPDALSGLGWSVAVSGDVIASVEADGLTLDLFIGSGGVWSSGTPTAQLTSSDGNGFISVAMSGNTIVAGSPGGATAPGAAYVFVEPTGGWTNMTETAKLTAEGAGPGDLVGWSVATSGNTAVVAAVENNSVGARYPSEPTGPGVAYVYERPTAGWSNMKQTAKLGASDGVKGDDFGFSVTIAGDTIAAGAPNATVAGSPNQGAVYVFQKRGPHWQSATETAKMTALNVPISAGLGTGVSMNGDTLGACSYYGAYIFVKPATGWVSGSQNATLTGTGYGSSGFTSLAISDRYLLAGLLYAPSGPRALGYAKPSTGWTNMTQTNNFTKPRSDPAGAGFAMSVAIGDKTLVVGSPLRGGDLPYANYVYVYGFN